MLGGSTIYKLYKDLKDTHVLVVLKHIFPIGESTGLSRAAGSLVVRELGQLLKGCWIESPS
jgi:hypothetical protein